MKRLWEEALGRPDADAIAFNSSENIGLDARLAAYDIAGSVAHAMMLGQQKIITESDANAIVLALQKTYADWKAGRFALNPELEDVHSNVENAVTSITPAGAKMHTGRSRNDQVLADMRMWMRDQSLAGMLEIIELQKAFAKLAKREGPFAGYTHTRVAQPITVSFWCDAQVQSLARDLARLDECYARLNQNPLGAGAMAGSGWKIDRAYTAKRLAFDSIQENELDAISSRGELEAEFTGHLALLSVKLSGLAEELIWLSQKGLVRVPDEFCTGSSMMPNKRNPDVLELVRGRASRVAARSAQLLSVKKGLMSGHHSDLQETKGAMMDAADTARAGLWMMAKIIAKLEFDNEKIRAELEGGYAQATEVADALARKGIPFREAHGIVGKLVRECEQKGIGLSQCKPPAALTLAEWKAAITLERARLKKDVRADEKNERDIRARQDEMAKAYGSLLGARVGAGPLDG